MHRGLPHGERQLRLVSMKKLLACLILLAAPAALFAQGIVSSADPRASEAGREILLAGGSAADAEMAMMLALTVVEPQSSGIGGGGFIVHHNGKTGLIETIDGREEAPSSATPNLFMGEDGKPLPFIQAFPGGKSVGVPGNIALMAKAHAKWGKLKWAQLFAPAIRLADKGYQVTPRLAGALSQVKTLWPDFPEAQAIYWQDGRPKRLGETVTNPALASFLRALAKAGPRAFYAGQNAKAIIAATGQSKRNPAGVIAKDLAGYRAVDRAAVCTTYRVYKVCGMGPPSSGATTVFQILGMLERFDMKALGKDSPKSWHLMHEAMRLAYADREKYLGDPDAVSVPVAGLLDKAYLAQRSALISADTSRADYDAGTPPGAIKRTAGISGEVSGTTNFVALDRAGNLATMTSTIEGPFGSQLIANGYFLNNELTDFTFEPEKEGAPVANRVEAGKRPLSSMSPTIVYGPDGKPLLAVGSAGGKRIIMHVTKTLIGVLDFGLSAQDAIALPNLFWAGDAVQMESSPMADALRGPLSQLGRTVLTSDLPSKLTAIEHQASGWKGAADPRSEGVALGE
jgi:gamma-glutamyltranspeptidase / glutathione hydrolase